MNTAPIYEDYRFDKEGIVQKKASPSMSDRERRWSLILDNCNPVHGFSANGGCWLSTQEETSTEIRRCCVVGRYSIRGPHWLIARAVPVATE